MIVYGFCVIMFLPFNLQMRKCKVAKGVVNSIIMTLA
jgi:hypothetical protein